MLEIVKPYNILLFNSFFIASMLTVLQFSSFIFGLVIKILERSFINTVNFSPTLTYNLQGQHPDSVLNRICNSAIVGQVCISSHEEQAVKWSLLHVETVPLLQLQVSPTLWKQQFHSSVISKARKAKVAVIYSRLSNAKAIMVHRLSHMVYPVAFSSFRCELVIVLHTGVFY